jgi:hypothetical protein
MPLHLVLAGDGLRCQLHLLQGVLGTGEQMVCDRLQAAVMRSLATISMRDAFTVVAANAQRPDLDVTMAGSSLRQPKGPGRTAESAVIAEKLPDSKKVPVNSDAPTDECLIPESLDKSLKMLRATLTEMDLDVVGEFAWQAEPRHAALSKTLLVNCPLLLFEAAALDRAAAVFFPLHVITCTAGDSTRVAIANPAAWSCRRLPVGAAEPLSRLVARVQLAFATVAERLAASH